jgi:agmatine/peptidylarginine deiminase
MEGVMIRYPFDLSYALIKEMAEDTKVVTIVLDGLEQLIVEQAYQQNGINLTNCSFLIAPSDTHWTRDYGPWFVFDGYGDQGIVDNRFPFPAPNDEVIPHAYGLDQGIPVYETGIWHAGGNYMTDGQGTAVSLDFLWSCNPGISQQEIYEKAYDFLGINHYLVLEDALGGFYAHIDCCAKYLAPNKIMVLQVPPSHACYDWLEELAIYFKNRVSCYGTPYEVFRVYSSGYDAYINSLILNHKVLLPFSGNQWDDDAVAYYEAAMPGYEVLGFIGPWKPTAALHCRTMGLTDRQMLYIHHVPLLDRPPLAQGFPIESEIIAYSGQAFIDGTPEVLWTTDGNWNSVPMTHVIENDYLAFIPAQPVGLEVRYYIHVSDGSGRSENHPYIGAPDAHCFRVSHFGAQCNVLSAEIGGVVDFFLNAGSAHGDRDYIVLGSMSGTEPGIPLPGGLILPLNWDLFTNLTLSFANTPFFADFNGKLDADGVGSAQFNTLGPLPRELEEVTLSFAFFLYSPFDFVSESVGIKVVE